MIIARKFAAVGAILSIAGCASTSPRMIYPLLPAPGTMEQGLDCAALTDQLEKADAIRWSIRESGVRRPAGSGTDALVAMGYMLAVATLVPARRAQPVLRVYRTRSCSVALTRWIRAIVQSKSRRSSC